MARVAAGNGPPRQVIPFLVLVIILLLVLILNGGFIKPAIWVAAPQKYAAGMGSGPAAAAAAAAEMPNSLVRFLLQARK